MVTREMDTVDKAKCILMAVFPWLPCDSQRLRDVFEDSLSWIKCIKWILKDDLHATSPFAQLVSTQWHKINVTENNCTPVWVKQP
jgi:hypothetical protein